METVETYYIIGSDADETKTADGTLAQRSIGKGFFVREVKEVTIYTENSTVFIQTISDMTDNRRGRGGKK